MYELVLNISFAKTKLFKKIEINLGEEYER